MRIALIYEKWHARCQPEQASVQNIAKIECVCLMIIFIIAAADDVQRPFDVIEPHLLRYIVEYIGVAVRETRVDALKKNARFARCGRSLADNDRIGRQSLINAFVLGEPAIACDGNEV